MDDRDTPPPPPLFLGHLIPKSRSRIPSASLVSLRFASFHRILANFRKLPDPLKLPFSPEHTHSRWNTYTTRFSTTIAKALFFEKGPRSVAHLSIGFVTHFLLITNVTQTPPCAAAVLFIEHTHKRKLTLRQVAVRPSRHPPTLFPIHLYHPRTHRRFLSNLTFSKLLGSDLQAPNTALPSPQSSYKYNQNHS